MIILSLSFLTFVVYQILTAIQYPFGDVESKFRIATNGSVFKVQQKQIIGWVEISTSKDTIEQANLAMKYFIEYYKNKKSKWKPV